MISKERLMQMHRSIRRNSFAVCCGLAPIILIIILFFTFDLGCNVLVNGKVVGTAKSKDCVYNLIDDINENFAPYFGGDDTITANVATTPKLVLKGHFTPEQKLGEVLKSTCPYLESAYSVKSNGITVVACTTKAERDEIYKSFINQFADFNNKSSYKVLDSITFTHELVPYGMIKSGNKAVAMLNRNYDCKSKVNVDTSLSKKQILKNFCISEKNFDKLNPDYTQGKTSKINVNSKMPYIRVMTTENVTEKTMIEYQKVTKNVNTLYKGEKELKSAGKNGFKTVASTVCKINGKDLYSTINREEINTPVNEVIYLGTKEMEKGIATGSFDIPYKKGTLSSRFGARGGRQHAGVDICGKIGDNIEASDGGEVVYAAWEDGYGNLVKIDHKNGYTTCYAHCDNIYVQVGDKVAKGDVIAALGNTGRSTGPHVHFEVRKTDTSTPLDPLNFVEY